MKLTKRILAILLCVMMVVTVFPASVFAETATATTEPETETIAPITPVKHAYWDFEDLAEGTTSANGTVLFNNNNLGFKGKNETWTVGTEEDGNRYISVATGDTRYLYDTADVLYRQIFEMSFRIRFKSSSSTSVSLVRLLYEHNYDNYKSDREEFIDVLAGEKNSDGGYDFVTFTSEEIGTSTSIKTGVTVDPEKWYDIAYRLDMETGEMVLYIDGTLVASGTVNVVKALIKLEATDPTKVNKVYGFELARSYSKAAADFDNIHIKSIASISDKGVTEYVNFDGGEGTAAAVGNTIAQNGGVYSYINTRYVTDVKNGLIYMNQGTSNCTSDAIQLTKIGSAIGSQPFEVFFDYNSLNTAEQGAFMEFVYNAGTIKNRRPLYVMEQGTTKVSGEIGFGFGGRHTTQNMLFHFPKGETHNIGVRYYPADQTYEFFLDGELAAYTTNKDGVYTLYRPHLGLEPLSCSIAVTDTVTAADVNAALKSTFSFEDSAKRYPVVIGETGTYVTSIELDRYVYGANHILDNVIFRDCAIKPYPYALSCACEACSYTNGGTSFAKVKENITLTDGVYSNATAGDTALLLDSSAVYGTGKTVISGKVKVEAGATADTLTLATVERYATDRTSTAFALSEIDANGNVFFAGRKVAKVATGVFYRFNITVDYATKTATLELFSNEKFNTKPADKWLVNETVGFGSRLDIAAPENNFTFNVEGDLYTLTDPGVATVLRLMETSDVTFSVSNFAVEFVEAEEETARLSYHNLITFEDATNGTLTSAYVDAQLSGGFASTTNVTTSSLRNLNLWKVADEQKYVVTGTETVLDEDGNPVLDEEGNETTVEVWGYKSAGNGNKVITQTTPGSFPLFSIFDTKGVLWDQPFEFSFDIYPKTAQVKAGTTGASNTGFISLGWDGGINSATRVNLLGMNGDGKTYTRIYRGDGDFDEATSKVADLYNNKWYNICVRVYPEEGRIVAFVDGEKLHESVLPAVKNTFATLDPEGAGISIGWNYGQSFDFDLDNISLRSIAEISSVNELIDFENAALESVPGTVTHETLVEYLNANSASTTAAAYHNDGNASYYYLAEDNGNWVMKQNVPANLGKNAGFNFKDATLLNNTDTLEITFDFKKITGSLANATNTVRFSGGTTMSPLTFRSGKYVSTGALGFAVFRKTADGFAQALLEKDKWYSFKVYTDLTGTGFKLWMKEGTSAVVADSIEWEPLYFLVNGTADGQALADGVKSQNGCLLAQTAASNTYPLADYEALMTTEGDMKWYNDNKSSVSFGVAPQVWFMYGTSDAWYANNQSCMDNLTIKTGDGELDMSFDFTPDNFVVTPEIPANTDWWTNGSFVNSSSKDSKSSLDTLQIVDGTVEQPYTHYDSSGEVSASGTVIVDPTGKYGNVIRPKETLGAFSFDDTEGVLDNNVFDISFDFYHTADASGNIHMFKFWVGSEKISILQLNYRELMITDTNLSSSRKSADVKTYLAWNQWYNVRVRFNLVEGYFETYVDNRLIHVQDMAETHPNLNLDLAKNLHFELHNHWGNSVKGYHFLDNVRVSIVDTAQPSFEGIRLLGVQQHNSGNAIRVLAGVTSLNYSNVGYTFELLDTATGGWRHAQTVITNEVYTSIVADGETIRASELGCVYFVMAVINDVHSEGTLCIRPYTTNNCIKNYGEEAIWVAKINDGGLFLEEGRIALSDESYTLYKHETFETANDTFKSYGTNYSESNTNEYRWGGQVNIGKAIVGSSTACARSGQKAMCVDNLLPEGTGTSFGGRTKLNNLMPYDLSPYLGKILKISAYVKGTNFLVHGEKVPMSIGIQSDKSTDYAAIKTYNVAENEWTLLEIEVRIGQEILDVMGEGYPPRVFISYGNSSNYAGTAYVDDIKISFKDSIGFSIPSIFANNMVVQRDVPTAVWGWDGLAGDVISATLGNQSASTVADKYGEFYLEIPAQSASKSETLTVRNETAGTVVSYTNVGIGEVLYCSGQSNMQLSIGAVHNTEELIANADNLDIRSFKMSGSNSVYTPQRDVKSGSWTQVTTKNVKSRSAIAYVTASQLQAELGCPVAIIEAFNGGSAANAWLSYDKVFAPERKAIYDDAAGLPKWSEFPDEDTQRHQDGLLRNGSGVEGRTIYGDYNYYWQIGTASEGSRADCLYGGYSDRFAPCGLYNGVQYPLKNYAVGAVLWYQGEARLNSMQPEQYNYILQDLIDQWREDFRNEDMPVVIFQLAPYSEYYNEIRQTQLDTAKRDEHVYAITTATEGAIYSTATGKICLDLDRSKKDDGTMSGGNAIHPGSKIPVATRAANTLLANEYGLASKYGSLLNPEYQSMSVNGNVVTLTFSDANGLQIHSGDTALDGFRAWDASGAELTVVSSVIDGDTVVVTTEEGTAPVTVTYGWKVSKVRREVNYPNIELNGTAYETQYINVMEGNLENSAGQPAIPFYASVSDISIYDASVSDGKLNVEIRELGHLCSTYKVVVDINGTATEYTASFTTAGNFVISGVAVNAGDSVTVTIKTADGSATIETKSITVA